MSISLTVLSKSNLASALFDRTFQGLGDSAEQVTLAVQGIFFGAFLSSSTVSLFTRVFTCSSGVVGFLLDRYSNGIEIKLDKETAQAVIRITNLFIGMALLYYSCMSLGLGYRIINFISLPLNINTISIAASKFTQPAE